MLSFNSRTPGGVRQIAKAKAMVLAQFQFTHPGRGATRQEAMTTNDGKFQFTHPGRGATTASDKGWTINYVSIHAPREGCDILRPGRLACIHVFQFTHPGRGATVEMLAVVDMMTVSIHAPREGCDRLSMKIGAVTP